MEIIPNFEKLEKKIKTTNKNENTHSYRLF